MDHQYLSKGLFLYPGGLVRPTPYAPSARTIAEAGCLVVISRVIIKSDVKFYNVGNKLSFLLKMEAT